MAFAFASVFTECQSALVDDLALGGGVDYRGTAEGRCEAGGFAGVKKVNKVKEVKMIVFVFLGALLGRWVEVGEVVVGADFARGQFGEPGVDNVAAEVDWWTLVAGVEDDHALGFDGCRGGVGGEGEVEGAVGPDVAVEEENVVEGAAAAIVGIE